tara:strand:+ start:859 stop:1326 length:468 start_codon:yes stop_codon:yes gene_type:complete
VEIVYALVIFIHPMAALMLIWAFMKQRKWRQRGQFLKGSKRQESLNKHQSDGNKMMLATVFVIILAFIGEISRALINGVPYNKYIIPNNFHASGGLLGLLLMTILWRMGHSTKEKKQSKQPFSKTRDLHGRIGDVMSILIIIHAFLGFLYLLQVM